MLIPDFSPSFKAYFNTPRCGLASQSATDAAKLFLDEMVREGSERSLRFHTQDQDEVKRVIAEYFDSSEKNIALIPNFTWGLNGLASGMDRDRPVWQLQTDYPSVRLAFETKGFKLVKQATSDGYHLDYNKVSDEVKSSGAQAIVISEVQFATGFRADLDTLGEIALHHNVSLIIDSTQSAGVVPFNASQFSSRHPGLRWTYSSSGYKWMNSGFGNGVLLVSDEFIASHDPGVAGRDSMDMLPDGPKYTPGIRSFEPGHLPHSNFIMMLASLQQHLEIGQDKIWEHSSHLTEEAVGGLVELGYEVLGGMSKERGAILSFNGSKEDLIRLNNAGVVCVMVKGKIRMGFHHHNAKEQIDFMLDVLKA